MKKINNTSFNKNTAEKIITEQAFIYQPQYEDDWKYSHHQFITFFKGRFYAMWSSGRIHEDVPGQRIMISSSADSLHWDVPYPLIDSISGEHVEVTLTAGGFYISEGKLNAYAGQYEYDINAMLPISHFQTFKNHESEDFMKMFPLSVHKNTKLLVMTTEDGMGFTEPIDTGLPVVPNFAPQKLQSGRILICGNVMFPYSDDRSGIRNWIKTGIYPKNMEAAIYDDAEGLDIVKREKGWTSHRCEGSFYQMPDGTINMLLRSAAQNGISVLYCTQSVDDGETWSEPAATEFVNDSSKFHFGMLPDGRYYYIGNPVMFSSRCPLALSVSDNGTDFSRHYIIENEYHPKRFEGIFKGGMYGYPHSMIHDGRMYVIYSINKESVAVSSFPVDSI
ncbi:MAG: exo-alpha-sialidase [Saccharofermentanales bacterium]